MALNARGGRNDLLFLFPNGTKSGDGEIGSSSFGGCDENCGEFIFNPLFLKFFKLYY